MRIRYMLVCVSAGLMGSAFAIQACGSTTDDGVTADAGPDVFEAAVIKDTSAPDVVDAAPACDKTKDLFSSIPDASIADGASSVGVCLGCAEAHCKSEINACKNDCACQGVAGSALECYAKTQSVLGCLGQFASVPKSTQTLGIALGGCVQSSCGTECAVAALSDGGADGGDADADAN